MDIQNLLNPQNNEESRQEQKTQAHGHAQIGHASSTVSTTAQTHQQSKSLLKKAEHTSSEPTKLAETGRPGSDRAQNIQKSRLSALSAGKNISSSSSGSASHDRSSQRTLSELKGGALPGPKIVRKLGDHSSGKGVKEQMKRVPNDPEHRDADNNNKRLKSSTGTSATVPSPRLTATQTRQGSGHSNWINIAPKDERMAAASTEDTGRDTVVQATKRRNKIKQTCEHCGQDFISSSEIGRHKIRREEGNVKCQVPGCKSAEDGEIFCNTTLLKNRHHNQAHQRVKFRYIGQHKCEKQGCEHTFVLKSDLVDHMKRHEDPEFGSCEYCRLAFHKRYLKEEHARQRAKFTCHEIECESKPEGRKVFCSDKGLRKHYKDEHDGKNYNPDGFKCDANNVCNKIFQSPSALNRHKKDKHG